MLTPTFDDALLYVILAVITFDYANTTLELTNYARLLLLALTSKDNTSTSLLTISVNSLISALQELYFFLIIVSMVHKYHM